jgi:NTE family protein
MPQNKTIALSLSGGGIRAMMFHMGVLQALAENGALEQISHMSSVSGGSLLAGLIFHENDMRWPSSDEYLNRVQPALRKKLCAQSMQWGAAMQLCNWKNWQYLLSRSNLLASSLFRDWEITEKLSDLPAFPEWSINGTTAETGKRFRFKRDSLGDYTLGYAKPNGVRLADAMAVSAAFPVGLGPLAIKTAGFEWAKRESWNSKEIIRTPPKWKTIHLYDGGLYDNLGLEPLLDIGANQLKVPADKLIVSDAGAPLPSKPLLASLNPFRIKRLLDIVMDQTRALRVRTLYRFMGDFPGKASYIYIAEPSMLKEDSDGVFSAGYGTSLQRPSEEAFSRIESYGYRCALRYFTNMSQVTTTPPNLA